MNNELLPPIIILAGYSCVGKSTIASTLCNLYSLDYIDQSSIYHEISHSKGYQRTRYWLANVGNTEFIKGTMSETINRIKQLEQSKGVLIDAHYGDEMAIGLREEFPDSNIIVVSVHADIEIREARMMSRLNASRSGARKEMEFRDRFLKEVGVEKAVEKADIVITNTGELADTIKVLVNELDRLGVQLSY